MNCQTASSLLCAPSFVIYQSQHYRSMPTSCSDWPVVWRWESRQDLNIFIFHSWVNCFQYSLNIRITEGVFPTKMENLKSYDVLAVNCTLHTKVYQPDQKGAKANTKKRFSFRKCSFWLKLNLAPSFTLNVCFPRQLHYLFDLVEKKLVPCHI